MFINCPCLLKIWNQNTDYANMQLIPWWDLDQNHKILLKKFMDYLHIQWLKVLRFIPIFLAIENWNAARAIDIFWLDPNLLGSTPFPLNEKCFLLTFSFLLQCLCKITFLECLPILIFELKNLANFWSCKQRRLCRQWKSGNTSFT